jgi:tetratricopeptide (TPR) repeat protein
MAGRSKKSTPVELRARTRALYHEIPVTPDNTRALRGLAWGLLGNLLISDYLNNWNEAERGRKAAKALLRDAERALHEAMQIDPKFSLTHYAKGLLHRAKGERDDALAAFEEAIKCDSKLARAHAQRGSELINKGQPKKALPSLKKALSLGNDDKSLGMFYWNLGRAYFFDEKYEEAIPWLVKAVEERPNLWYNWLYLVSAHALSGDEPKAKAVWKKFQTHENFSHLRFTLELVMEYEKVNRTQNAVIRKGRRKFHKGLGIAGMPKK